MVSKTTSALNALIKKAEKAMVDTTNPSDLVWHPTGSTTFDALTANGHDVTGGFPGGRIIELYGNESSGKTTLALQAAARMQKEGKLVVYVDFERTFHEEYATSLGVDTTDFIEDGGLFWLLEPDHVEQAFTIMDEMCENEATKDIIGMFIVDSVAAMDSIHSQEDKEKVEQIGLLARALSRLLKPFARKLKETDAVAIFINQTREKVGGSPFGDPTTTPGGKALKFYASMRIALARGFKIPAPMLDPLTGKREKGAIGHWVKIKVKKNKVTGEFHKEPEVPIVDNLGVDDVLACINHGKTLGLVSGSGWYEVSAEVAGEKIRGQGDFGLRTALVSNPEACARFQKAVADTLRSNFRQLQLDRQSGRIIDSAEGESV